MHTVKGRSHPLAIPISRRQTLFLLGGLLPTLLMTGCTTGRTPAPGSGGSAPTGINAETVTPNANSLRYALTSQATTLDPATVQDGTTIDLLQQIYEGLVHWDEKGQIAPDIAEKWDVSPDGKTYTFHLKHGVKFHNGREVNADDFKYSFERACDPKTKSTTVSDYLKDIVGVNDRLAGKATDVSGVKVVDPYTLQITIDSFKPYWLGNMTYPIAYVVCKEAIAANGGNIDSVQSAVGTGPFKLVSYQPNYKVILAANPDYHDGRPRLDYIVRPVLTDAETRMSKYQADELDIVDVSFRDLDKVNADPKLKPDLQKFERAATWYVGLNSAAPDSPFGKKEVRQAFAMAVDKKEVVRVALKDEVKIADSIVPPGFSNYTPHVTPLPYDPAKAKALLAQAGYPGGKGFPALTFSFRNDMPHVGDTAQVVARQLQTNLGLSIQLRPMEWGQFLTERDHKTLALTHLRWGADYLDPQNFLSVLLHTSHLVNGQEDHPENGVGYSNPEFDKLCDQADVEHDPKKRMDLYHQAEQIAVNDAPWIPLYFQVDLELIKPRVHNIRDTLLGHLPYVTTTVTP